MDSFAEPVQEHTLVSNGQYSVTLLMPYRPSGEVMVETDFSPGDPGQPPAVTQRFGADGSDLKGPGTFRRDEPDDNSRWFAASTVVTFH